MSKFASKVNGHAPDRRPICPACGKRDGWVCDSRFNDHQIFIRRRRACYSCLHRWTTYEITEERFVQMESKEKQLDKLVGSIASLINSAS